MKQPRLNKLTPPFDTDPYFIRYINRSMVTAKRRNKSTTQNKEHFIFSLSITKINWTIEI